MAGKTKKKTAAPKKVVEKKEDKILKSTKIVLYIFKTCQKGKREGVVCETNSKGKLVNGKYYPFNYLHGIPNAVEKILVKNKISMIQM